MQLLKLKSKTLIEFFGQDTLFADDFKEITELLISSNDGHIDQQEAALFEEDLASIYILAPDIREVKLENIDMTNISIDKIMKDLPYDTISFNGSEELFSDMRNRKINLSDLTSSSLSLDKETGVSEFDFFKQLKLYKRFNLYPNIDIDDLELALKYIDISEVKVKIRTPQDFEKLQSLMHDNEVEIHLDINGLRAIDGLKNQPSFKINLTINDMSELSLEDLGYFKDYNISVISIQQELSDTDENSNEVLLEMVSNNREKYDLETYRKLRQAVDSVIQGIDLNSPDVERFLTVYKRLALKISYDHDEYDHIDEETGVKYINGYPPDHNLVGGLLHNTCVCEGYAKILKQCLACVNIPSNIIIGYSLQECHAWNQVELDGSWYNTDLTWDAVNIKENRELDYCLQNDIEFINHSMESYMAHFCYSSFDRNRMHKFLGIPFSFHFEEQDFSVPNVVSLIQNLNESSVAGTRIEVNKDYDTGNYHLSLGNIIDDNICKYSENSIELTPKNMAAFIQEYRRKFDITQIQAYTSSSLIKTNEGIEILMNEDVKADMLNYGVSVDNLLKPSKQNITSLIDISSTGIWSRILNSLKSRFTQIQQSLFSKKDNEHENDKPTTKQSKSPRLPSWDLRNWPTDELALRPIQSKNKQQEENKDLTTFSIDDDQER